MIKIDNVGFAYPNGQHALEGINAQVASGKICGLVGMNGAGKSTLFKLLTAHIKSKTGRIEIKGSSVKKALQQNLISYVPQSDEVDWDFPVLVKDVVMMGRYGHMGFMRRASKTDHEAVDNALERVNLIAFKDRQIGELSGGQKKRVFVARALAQGSEIILLDEPFTGIDIKTEDALIALFKALAAEGKLILVSTHNLGSVPSFCDEVMLINKTLLAHGPVETTFTQENLSKAFGGMLRHHHLVGDDLHDDEDARTLTVLSDDERPLVFYGEQGGQKITQPGNKDD
ncbi:MAG: ATP-binding cassette domain-containing protein [Micavibrio sp.]|nr:ATP-binding cassette domain-containing protein [Micavibrio sp.]